ncbi:DNA gyrase inhibitor YacG [compost metagenome]
MSDNENKNKTQVKCPQCGRLTFYSPENEFRPFCSDRCKLIDLGAWADESYKIPSSDSLTNDEEDDLDADHEH